MSRDDDDTLDLRRPRRRVESTADAPMRAEVFLRALGRASDERARVALVTDLISEVHQRGRAGAKKHIAAADLALHESEDERAKLQIELTQMRLTVAKAVDELRRMHGPSEPLDILEAVIG